MSEMLYILDRKSVVGKKRRKEIREQKLCHEGKNEEKV